MATQAELKKKMADLIFTLRQRCATKDMYFVHEFGITIAEYNCMVLFFSRASYGVKDLAHALDITPGGVTRIITSLEKKNIIRRKISIEDRRNINVSLTRKGQQMVDGLRTASEEIHGKILKKIDAPFRGPVIEALGHLTDGLDAWIAEHNKSKKPHKL